MREIKERVLQATLQSGRAVGAVRLIAVSKRQPPERVTAAYQAGQRDFGENYVQGLLDRRTLLPNDAILHLIGHVQTNKVKGAAQAHYLHTLDSPRLVEALAKVAPPGIKGLIEVNLAQEDQKAGVPAAEVEPLIERIRATHLELVGLMCIPPEGEGGQWFGRLARLAEDLRAKTGLPLPELSMGMSADFEEAIRAGATMVRVGTAIFGERQS
ncbi:MAG: YggS family pyridoxal phosphate-dependent enzyme [Deltaproteobacteria bacterium]|nr:YggS family pyridoxal phosphate-dependent enzyme [Deltaproteobacteria bacterium]